MTDPVPESTPPATPDSSPYLKAGQTVVAARRTPSLVAGRYEIIREIGSGGMGSVYLAQDRKLNRYIAIKRLRLKGKATTEIKQRFLREAQTIASLGHFHIVNVFDIGQDEFGYYITMEYVPGPTFGESHIEHENSPTPSVTLERYVKLVGALPPEDARRLIIKICSAVDYAHKMGVIHRDIKPANILLDPDYEPKLVDFGLACPISREDGKMLTREGFPLGTPEYAAPEQWKNAAGVDARTDIYALGGILWFMLTAEIPRYFREASVPPAFRQAVSSALSQKPEDRFASAGEFAAAIDSSDAAEVSVGEEAVGQEAAGGIQWTCSNCNGTNPEQARYCVHCGTFGMEICPNCEAEIRVGVRFCPECGIDIDGAQKTASIVVTARNFAKLLEYEQALSILKNIGKGTTEVEELSKQWHQLLLKRRNLFSDLESAFRVFNLAKAIDVATQLKPLIPPDCLSDSADYEVCTHYLDLMERLKEQLNNAAAQARKEYNLKQYSAYVSDMVRLFGEEECEALVAQVDASVNELNHAIAQAGLAIGMNCFSTAMVLLAAIPPWKGGELGTRRQKMEDSCRRHLAERDQTADDIEEHIRNERYIDALALLRQGSRFRLPPRHVDVSPVKEDLEANERILRIDKDLTHLLGNEVSKWVEAGEWGPLARAIEILREGEASSWKRLTDVLRKAAAQGIQKRYDQAIFWEKKSKFRRSDRIWEELLSIPSELIPPNIRAYAEQYSRRREISLSNDRRQSTRLLVIILLCCWLYPACFFVQSLIKEGSLSTVLRLHAVTVAQGIGFFLVLFLFRLKVVTRDLRFQYLPRLSPRKLVVALLLILSPAAQLVAVGLSRGAALRLGDIPVGGRLMLVILGGFWLICDIAVHTSFRFPAAFAFTLSWIIAAPIAFLPADVADSRRWAICALVQVGVYILLHAGQAKRSRSAGETAAASVSDPPDLVIDEEKTDDAETNEA